MGKKERSERLGDGRRASPNGAGLQTIAHAEKRVLIGLTRLWPLIVLAWRDSHAGRTGPTARQAPRRRAAHWRRLRDTGAAPPGLHVRKGTRVGSVWRGLPNSPRTMGALKSCGGSPSKVRSCNTESSALHVADDALKISSRKATDASGKKPRRCDGERAEDLLWHRVPVELTLKVARGTSALVVSAELGQPARELRFGHARRPEQQQVLFTHGGKHQKPRLSLPLQQAICEGVSCLVQSPSHCLFEQALLASLPAAAFLLRRSLAPAALREPALPPSLSLSLLRSLFCLRRPFPPSLSPSLRLPLPLPLLKCRLSDRARRAAVEVRAEGEGRGGEAEGGAAVGGEQGGDSRGLASERCASQDHGRGERGAASGAAEEKGPTIYFKLSLLSTLSIDR
eukprot:scaffold212257_cov31-Tisochrysis_lutea.AAC.3